MLLLIAAGLKLYGLSVSAMPRVGWFSQGWVQLLAVKWERVLGVWLVSGMAAWGLWLAAFSVDVATVLISPKLEMPVNTSQFQARAVMAVALAVFASVDVAAQPPAPAELLAAMRSGAADLVKIERAETSYRCRETTKQQQRKSSSSTVQIWRSGEDILIETNKGRQRTGLNAHYLFIVERGQAAGEWKLTRFFDTDHIQLFDTHSAPDGYAFFPLTTLGSSNATLQKWLAEPKFRLTATRLGRAGTIEADFVTEVNRPNAPPNTPALPLTGTITVSAKQPGLVLAYTQTGLSGVKYTMTRQVDEVGAGYRCRSLTCESFNAKKGGVFQTRQIEFTDYGANPIDHAEFYLSHYGIPEPVGVVPPSKRTPRYLWLLVAAESFAILAILFRWLARRWRAAPAASMPTTPTVI